VLKSTIGSKFAEFITLFGKVLACVLISTWTALKLSAVLLFSAAITLAIILVLKRKLNYLRLKEKRAYSIAHLLAKKLLNSIRTVIALGMEKKAAKMYKKSLKSTEVWIINKGFWIGALNGLQIFFHNFTFVILILVGVSLNKHQSNVYTPGLIMQTFYSVMFVIDSLERLVVYLKDSSVAWQTVTSLFEKLKLYDSYSEKINVNKRGEKIYNLKGEISFENVTFTYPSVPSVKKITEKSLSMPKVKIFENLSFTIPAGKTVAICGSRY